MITKIDSVTVVVSDQEKALEFYTQVLGWEKRIDNMVNEEFRFLTVGPVGAEVELVLGQESVYGGRGTLNPNANSGIALIADDVQETYNDLSAKGVSFHEPPSVMPWGALATWFSDPDGNSFFLTEDQ